MKILEILSRSSIDYRVNLVLIIPPLIDLVRTSVRLMFSSAVVSQLSNVFNPFLLAFVLLDSVTALLVLLGQCVMTGKVISEAKTKLADWITYGKKFFFTVLGISILFGLIIFSLNRLTTPYLVWVTPENFYSPRTLLITIGFGLFAYRIPQGFFFFWLASAILSGKGTVRSLIDALKALRHCFVVFGGFALMYFVVQDFSDLLIDYVFRVQPLIGNLTISHVLSGTIDAALSPLWFLMAFSLYRMQQTKQVGNPTGN